ncbi:MAG: hypothetical protein RQ754_03165 [Desulfuromonadales bacterium]|nr:hypothetical protein [Desulfuromonadales bacterium]
MKKNQKQDGVFREAWENMSNDISKLLPQKLQRRAGKKKMLILLAIVELLVLGAAGKFLYDWLLS